MSKSTDTKAIQNIVKTEMLSFIKTFIPQLEKTLNLFDIVDGVQGQVDHLNKKIDSIGKTVGGLLPMIDSLEANISFMKDKVENEKYMKKINTKVKETVKKEMKEVRIELANDIGKSIKKDEGVRQTKKNIQEVSEKLKLIETDFDLYKDTVENKLKDDYGSLKRLVIREGKKSSVTQKDLNDVQKEFHKSYKELMSFIDTNYVSATSQDFINNKINERLDETSNNLNTINTNLSGKIASICKLMKKSVSKEMNNDVQTRVKDNNIENKLNQINHVS